MRRVYQSAMTNAIMYGCGFVRISYVDGEMIFTCVNREEFRDVADELIWLDNNARRETKQ